MGRAWGTKWNFGLVDRVTVELVTYLACSEPCLLVAVVPRPIGFALPCDPDVSFPFLDSVPVYYIPKHSDLFLHLYISVIYSSIGHMNHMCSHNSIWQVEWIQLESLCFCILNAPSRHMYESDIPKRKFFLTSFSLQRILKKGTATVCFFFFFETFFETFGLLNIRYRCTSVPQFGCRQPLLGSKLKRNTYRKWYWYPTLFAGTFFQCVCGK